MAYLLHAGIGTKRALLRLPIEHRPAKVLFTLANPIQALTLDVNGIKIALHL